MTVLLSRQRLKQRLGGLPRRGWSTTSRWFLWVPRLLPALPGSACVSVRNRSAGWKPDDGWMAVRLSSYSPGLRKGHLAARVLRRNVALPTGRNPEGLVFFPIGGATGRAGRQARRAPCVGSPRAA